MSTLEDIAAIRAVKIAYTMQLPLQIHPMNKAKEYAQTENNQETESDVGETSDSCKNESEAGNDTESCTDGEEDAEEDEDFQDQRDGDGGSEDEDDNNNPNKSSALEVLRLTFCPSLTFPSTVLSLSSSSTSSSPSSSAHKFPCAFSFMAAAFHGAEAANSPYKVIGRGTCCTVYSASPLSAIKISSDASALWNDVQLTQLAHEVWKAKKALLGNYFPKSRLPRVPSIHRNFSKELLPQWWATHANLLPEHEKGKHVFYLERIPAISSAAVSALLTLYPPRSTDRQMVEKRDGHACLVRPCLGIRSKKRGKKHADSMLWNHPLYLDQLLQIVGAEGVKHIAKEMALGLALLHWGAGVDGLGVKFVIGASKPDISSLPHEARKNGEKTRMWILDFDKASLLDWSDWDRACRRMVTAVTASNSCFPAPRFEAGKAGVDKVIRAAFEEVYIKASKLLVARNSGLIALAGREGKEARREEITGWPEQFVRAWKVRSREQIDMQDHKFTVLE